MGQSRVLVVDDDQALLSALVETLRSEGYLAQPAISGDVALVLLQHRVPFRLLITDVVLPGVLDGFGLARRARLFWPSIPVIYSTGHPHVARVRAHGAPYGDLLVKPWKVETLLTTVSTALKERYESDGYGSSNSSGPHGSHEASWTPPTQVAKRSGSAAAANIELGECPDFRLRE